MGYRPKQSEFMDKEEIARRLQNLHIEGLKRWHITIGINIRQELERKWKQYFEWYDAFETDDYDEACRTLGYLISDMIEDTPNLACNGDRNTQYERIKDGCIGVADRIVAREFSLKWEDIVTFYNLNRVLNVLQTNDEENKNDGDEKLDEKEKSNEKKKK